MPRTRVLHLIQNLNYGGMERVLSDLVLGVDRDRFESHVLCLQFLGRFSAGLDAVATLHVADRMSRYSMIRPHTLATQLRRIAPDVLHSHSGVWYKGSLAARMAGVPRIVHTEHGRARPDPWQHRLVDGLAARRTDAVVAVSEALSGQLQRTLRVPARKLVLIRNGVDTAVYRPIPDTGAVRRELGIPSTARIIGSIGRLESIKGYDVMVEAFSLLQKRLNGVEAPFLVVGGEGADRARLDALVEARGLKGKAFLLGWRDDVHDLQSCFTLFTMSSRSEGTSISLLEAMAAGLCPIVTDVGGNGAVLGDGLKHRLVPSEHPEALAEAWASALSDPAGLDRDAAAARQRVQHSFGVETMVREYQRVYSGELPAPVAASGT